MVLYWFARLILSRTAQVIWRIKVVGADRLPATGGYVFAPSHRSMIDIPLVGLVTPRRVRFMGKAPLFRIPVLSSLFRALGGFPVERDGNDRKAVRDSVAMLESGDVLAVFPEGTRQNGPKIQPLQPGAAYLAFRAGVPIVPLGMAGSEEIMRSRKHRFFAGFASVVIVVGEPVIPPERTTSSVPRASVDMVTARLADDLQVAFDEAYRLRDA